MIITAFSISVVMISASSVQAQPWVFVADWDAAKVIRINLSTGEDVLLVSLNPGDLLTPNDGDLPKNIELDGSSYILVGLRGGSKNIKRFTLDGTFVDNFTGQVGAFGPNQMRLVDGELLVAGGSDRLVWRFEAATGAVAGSFTANSCCAHFGLALSQAHIYVGEIFSRRITRFNRPLDGSGGTVILPTGSEYFEDMHNIEIGHNGNLFVTGISPTSEYLILEFDVNTGTLVGTFFDLRGEFGDTGPVAAQVRYDSARQRYYVAYRGHPELIELDTTGILTATYQSQHFISPSALSFTYINPVCPDLTADSVVNFTDITAVLGNWLTNSPFGDANHDGIVNFADITMILGHWLEVCP